MQFHHWDGPAPDGEGEEHQYGSWDGFLGAMRSDRRRELLRERRRLQERGVVVEASWGTEMGEEDWAAAQRFYRDTVDRKWGDAYLTPAFFQEALRTMAGQIRFFAARREGRLIGGALCWEGDGALFGRYWGCDEQVPVLHFECCYYAPIEDCFARGLARFEAGAQGEHKVARGLVPRATWSLHRVRHPGLHAAVAEFVVREADAVAKAAEGLAAHGPWRRG
jgi:predicted N-acyltransferase